MNDSQYKLLIGKSIRVRSNTGQHNYKTGKDYILTRYNGDGTFRAKDDSNPEFIGNNLYYQDFDIIDNITGDTEEKGFVKKPVLKNEKDNYGIEAVLELKDDEETIYLSSSVRNILEVENGMYIGFAVDYDSNSVYIFKETEVEAGLKIDDTGCVKSLGMHRDLVNYLFSKQMSLEPKRIKNPDFVDNVFYRIVRYNPDFRGNYTAMMVPKVDINPVPLEIKLGDFEQRVNNQYFDSTAETLKNIYTVDDNYEKVIHQTREILGKKEVAKSKRPSGKTASFDLNKWSSIKEVKHEEEPVTINKADELYKEL